jgi:uncharacterized membrane protein
LSETADHPRDGQRPRYDVCQGYKGPIVGDLLPVTMSDCGDYGEVDTWTVDVSGHPLVAGLPTSWSDDAGWSTVTAISEATAISATTLRDL